MAEDEVGVSVRFRREGVPAEVRYDPKGELVTERGQFVLHCTASGKLVFRDKVPQGPFPKDYVKT